MSKPTQYSRKSSFVSLLLILTTCAVAAITLWSFSPSMALSPIMKIEISPTSTMAQFHAYAELPKPTYTASPTLIPSPTSIPTEIPTNAPGPMAYAEIVADTPTMEYNTANIEDPFEGSSSIATTYGGNKYVLVDISEQHMYVYEGDTLIQSFITSTGMNNATRTGNFSVMNKIPNAYGATWNIWMPNWLGIYWAGSMQNGIHALPILPNGSQLWAGYLGTPISYGCVVLGAYEAQLLYDWAEIGTPVEIRW